MPYSFNLITSNEKKEEDSSGARIRRLRMDLNMTIKELAQLIEIRPKSLNRIELNQSIASLSTLRKLSKILKAPIWYLGYFETLPENTFGQKLQKARLYYGYTKKEFARILNINEKTITNIEKDLHNPSPITKKAILPYLKTLKQ